MPVPNTYILSALHDLTSSQWQERARAADELAELTSALDGFQAELLAGALVLARLNEEDAALQEAQMNTLGELKAWHDVRPSTLAPLRDLDLSRLSGSQVEHFADLFEQPPQAR